MGAFKTYDIRGVYGDEIDEDLAYKVGRAFARFLGQETYLVGYDARLHSEALYRALIKGLVHEGKRVVGIGRVSTPQLHFFQIQEGFQGGVMVTASHNPPEYHGFKLFDGTGGSVSYAKGLDVMERMIEQMGQDPPLEGGSYSEESKLAAYIDFVTAPLSRGQYSGKIVIDPGSGSSGPVFRALAEALGLEAVIIHEQPDGHFPHRGPNPLKPESKVAAAAKVREVGADLGALLDGDGDRVLFLDEQGESIENYFLSALIAEELLADHPGASIVYDLISSRVLPERIRELGGRPVVSRVGYTFIYDNMVSQGAIFGSETSGHVYFKVSDSYYTESAAYALVLLLKLLEKKGAKLSELVAPLKARYVQAPEINIQVQHKEKVLKGVEERYGQGRIDKMDGISVSFPDYWFNIRPSNTEPVIRLRLEAVSREVAQGRAAELRSFVEEVGG